MSVTSEKITSNTSYYISSLTFNKVLAFIYFIIIARFLGAADIGKYILAISLTQIMAIFIDIGLSPTIIREVARNKESINRYASNIIIYKLLAGLVIYGVLIILAHLFNFSFLVRQLIYLAGLVMLLDSMSLLIYAMLRGLHNLRFESFAIFIYQIIVLIIGLTGLWLGAGVHILMIALMVGSTFNLLYALYALKLNYNFSFKLNLDWKNTLKPILVLALPFGLAGIFIKMYQLADIVLLSLLSSEQEVGWYGVAHKLVFSFEFIPLAFMGSLFPAMSNFFIKDKTMLIKSFHKATHYLAIIVAPIMLGGFVMAEPIVRALYGDEFIPSIISLRILLLGLLFIFIIYPLNSFLAAIDRQKTSMCLMGITALISLTLNFMLIPILGGVGAALAFITSLLFLFISSVFFVQRYMRISFLRYFIDLLKIISLAGIMAFIVYLLAGISSWWLTLIMGVIIYVILILSLRIIPPKEFKYIYNSFGKKD